MSDLFGGQLPDPAPQPDPYAGMGQDARRTAKRRELLAAGIQPATKLPLSNAHAGSTCGACAHAWRKAVNSFAGWKCDRAAARGLDGPDIRKSWPACTLFQAEGDA